MLEASELNDLRQAVLRGEKIDDAKYHEVIQSLRTKRSEDIAAAGARKEKAAKKAAGTSDDELNSILGF